MEKCDRQGRRLRLGIMWRWRWACENFSIRG